MLKCALTLPGAPAILTSAPLAGCTAIVPTWWKSETGPFEHGVASGDPLQDRVILWTRVSGATEDEIEVSWYLSHDPDCEVVTAFGSVVTSSDCDFTVKIDAESLSPDTVYYYRFACGGRRSPVGRTKTLPAPPPADTREGNKRRSHGTNGGEVDRVRLAAVSCSNFPAGYFHVYERLAEEELDVVLHLGDYLYEYSSDGYATEDAEKLGRVPEPEQEALTLADYRARHAQYRRDVQLQARHARHPFIIVWDDHELANNAYHDGALNHNSYEGEFLDRRAAALRAWFEWMPIRPPSEEEDVIYRTFEFGDLARLVMLDTRHRGRDEQLNLADYRLASTEDVVTMKDDATSDARTMLGIEQKEWFREVLKNGSQKWQILGQQVLMGRYHLPAAMVDAIDRNGSSNFEAGVLVGARAVAALATAPAERSADEVALIDSFVPHNLDAWDGYAAERDEILRWAAEEKRRLVVVAGDTHNAWASRLTTVDGTVVGAEFGTASVTSPGYERDLGLTNARTLGSLMEGLVPDLRYTNFEARGYLVLEVQRQEVSARFEFISGVKERAFTRLGAKELRLDSDLDLRVV